MTKAEAATLLGISRRTLQRRMSRGEIAYTLVPVPQGKEAVFERAEVERVRAEDRARANGVTLVPAVVAPLPSRLPARRPATAIEGVPRDDRLIARAIILPARLAYTLREAAEISGLSVKHIRWAVRAGLLAARRLPAVRGKRISRAALEEYLSYIFTLAP